MTNDETNANKEGKLSLWQQIKEDFSVPKLNDPALDSSFELFFNYPGVWAIINHRIAHKLYTKGWKKLSRAIVGIGSLFTKQIFIQQRLLEEEFLSTMQLAWLLEQLQL